MQLGGRDLEQRGLAGAVGAEDHPALVLLDRPVDVVEQRGPAPAHRHPCELEDGGHGGNPTDRRRRDPGRNVAGRDRSEDWPSPLPAAVRLAWWGTAWLRGHVVADHLIDAVVDQDATHLVAFPDEPAEPLVTGLGRLRTDGADALGAALPAEGDPVGLGGPRRSTPPRSRPARRWSSSTPPAFALRGLVPGPGRRRRHLAVLPAERRQLPDVGEADRMLRAALPEAADALAALDVARWRPEVADRLMNLRHRPRLVAPPGVPPAAWSSPPGGSRRWRSSSSPWRTTAAP